MRLLFYIFFLLLFSCRQAKIIHPQQSDVVEAVYASGKILSDSEYFAYALNGGTITRKLVNEGESVKSGQVLYEIESDVPAARATAARSAFENVQTNLSAHSRILNDLKLTLQSAKAKCKNDSLHFFRLKNLFDQGIGMQSAVDNAHTAYLVSRNTAIAAAEKYSATKAELQVSLQQAKSVFAAAQAEVRNTYIRSQVNGTVYQLLKKAGEAVRPNDAVALLGSSGGRIIKLAVDQQDINKIKLGQPVLLKTDITGNLIYTAIVKQIYPSMNEADQTFRVDAVFAKNEHQPFIHSSVEANIIVQEKKKALVLPRNALRTNDSVQIKEGGKLKMVAVQIGIKTPDVVEIISGVSLSSSIVFPDQK